ncbi:MAG: hypothetical protein IJ509_03605 [Bacilli bacterium]|nr:hypothetical protein [Bacilli bacterium]
MTLYEELYHNTPNLSKFYRFEGLNSYPYFCFQNEQYLTNIIKYIYFSKNEKHHMYYVTKKLRQLISKEILKDMDLQFNKKVLLDSRTFAEIERYIENYSFEDKMISIEFSLLPIIDSLLDKNTISNRRKHANDRRVEKVDSNIHSGGYGFCEEWLKVFNLLTLFYSYRRITNDNILEFLHIYRRNLIETKNFINPVSFLFEEKTRVVKINNKIYCDFNKYELMDALERIVEYQLFFPESILGENPYEQIKKVINEYTLKREHILKLSDSIFKR